MGWADAHVDRLRHGETVAFRPRGNSMTPRIRSGQLCTLEPTVAPSAGDVVLCKVSGRVYLHLVRAIRRQGESSSYLIGNAHGGTNGWTTTVYGKLVRVDP